MRSGYEVRRCDRTRERFHLYWVWVSDEGDVVLHDPERFPSHGPTLVRPLLPSPRWVFDPEPPSLTVPIRTVQYQAYRFAFPHPVHPDDLPLRVRYELIREGKLRREAAGCPTSYRPWQEALDEDPRRGMERERLSDEAWDRLRYGRFEVDQRTLACRVVVPFPFPGRGSRGLPYEETPHERGAREVLELWREYQLWRHSQGLEPKPEKEKALARMQRIAADESGFLLAEWAL